MNAFTALWIHGMTSSRTPQEPALVVTSRPYNRYGFKENSCKHGASCKHERRESQILVVAGLQVEADDGGHEQHCEDVDRHQKRHAAHIVTVSLRGRERVRRYAPIQKVPGMRPAASAS
jgi:hypothetical protein